MRGALTLSLAILLGRFSGLIRDMILSRSFGVSSDYDVYSLSIMIPFFLRRIFAEGALTSAYIPIYNEMMKIKDEKANEFTSTVITIFSFITIPLIILVEVFPCIILNLFASGLDPERMLKADMMVRITFPFVFFITIWAIAYGFLNSHFVYFKPAFSQVIANTSLIAGTIISVSFGFGITGVAISFCFGGFLQMIYLLKEMKKEGFKFDLKVKKDGIKDFMRIFSISSMSFSISQINSIVDLNVASRLPEGSISLMQYSLRIYNLPLGIFTVAFSTYIFPKLSKMNSKGKTNEFSKNLRDVFFFIIPSMLLFLTLGDKLISLIYKGGQFTYLDVLKTQKVLFMYSLGLPFYSFVNMAYKLHYSSKDPVTVTKTTVWMVLTNVVLDLTFYRFMGVSGIALATTISGAVGCIRISFSKIIREHLKLDMEYIKIISAGLFIFIVGLVLKRMEGSIIPILLFIFIYLLFFLPLRSHYSYLLKTSIHGIVKFLKGIFA